MSIGVCINKDIEKLSRKRATRSVVHRALLLGRWQDERALILFRFAVSQQFSRGVAKKKRVLTPLVRSAIRPRRERLKNLAATRTAARKRAATSAPHIAVANGCCSRVSSERGNDGISHCTAELEVVEAPQAFIHLLLESIAAP